MSPRFSAIDVGSNAFRLVIAERCADHNFNILKKERIAVRLGADAFEKGQFSEHTQEQAIKAFEKFAALHKKYKVKNYIACATSAMRESRNSKELIETLYKKTKIRVQIINGLVEGRLIREAILEDVRLDNSKTCFIDIGGGSVEITFNANHKQLATQSFPMGTVRTLQLRTTMSPKDNLKQYEQLITPYISQHLKQQKHFDFGVGTGGNIESLGRLRVQILKNTPNTRVTLNELLEMKKALSRLNYSDRVSHFQLRPDRADVIIPALDVLILIMRKVKIKDLKIPYVGLREGLLLSLSRT